MGKKHCSTMCQIVWTIIYIITWLMLINGCILYHVALMKVVPELQDLPDNLIDGFNKVLGFDYLEEDSAIVKAQAEMSLGKCFLPASQCSTGMSSNDPRTADTTAEKALILSAFQRSLDQIKKVTGDKYFGTDSLKSTHDQLQTILDDINAVDATGLCYVQTQLYCEIRNSADILLTETQNVKSQIDEFTDSQIVKNWQEASDGLVGLHALPYILVLSALFFCCLWYKDGTCCCCRGGSAVDCCIICMHGLLWLVFFVLSTIICIVAAVVMYGADRIKVTVLKGEPSVEEFLDHVETTYPEFWDLVFKDMIPGLEFLYQSAVVFEVFCVVIVIYGCCMCCCRPYTTPEEDDKVVAM